MLLADFIKAWPFVYHITFLRNLNAIRMLRKLYTAEQVLDRAGQIKIAERRREKDVIVSLGAFTFIIRSQQPLDPDCLILDSGLTLLDYVQELNRKVFFWPGNEDSPLEDGKRMIKSQYVNETAILRVPSSSLFKLNDNVRSFYSLYNTGAAWFENGKKSRRGSSSFLYWDQFRENVADIAEVGFEGTTNLPNDTEIACDLQGPWEAI